MADDGPEEDQSEYYRDKPVGHLISVLYLPAIKRFVFEFSVPKAGGGQVRQEVVVEAGPAAAEMDAALAALESDDESDD